MRAERGGDEQEGPDPVVKTTLWSTSKVRRLQRLLLDWYRQHRRPLPWREIPNPYHVWVSELMLQQTQVRTMLPYYERFLQRFPDLQRLASADPAEVLSMWAGLGYYRRARDIHRAARLLIDTRRGDFPRTFDEWMKLPGVGRYTAGAVLSIAFNQPYPAVDGNVRRVIHRLHGLRAQCAESFAWKKAEAYLPRNRASEFNQALMELGATVCRPRGPLCEACPVSGLCEARRRGTQERTPARRPDRTSKVHLLMLVLKRRGRVLLAQHHQAPFLPGAWGLPTRVLTEGDDPAQSAEAVARSLVRDFDCLERCAPVRHAVTYRRVLIEVFAAECAEPGRQPGSGLQWAAAGEAARMLTSSAFHKALVSAGRARRPQRPGSS